ncbi:MAG TPA: hypothetical protein PLB59_08590 [Bacteroidales bacterium]|nr:hypothetical protein [Bacteroidales bacterium]HPI30429.1 hypothetical protein [Bacteroidales bacterium]HQP16013.1 hypothetical protein [Bacteroidales bacterium]
MKKEILFLLLLIYSLVSEIFAQQQVVFHINQPTQLTADAGLDSYIPVGDSNIIGGMPAASGGSPAYSYLWTPGDYLNDSTLANPVVTPLSSVTYLLTVVDSRNCMATDEIYVLIDSSNITAGDEYHGNNPVIYYLSDNRAIYIKLNHSFIKDESVYISVNDLSGRTIINESVRTDRLVKLVLPASELPEIVILNLFLAKTKWSYKILTN